MSFDCSTGSQNVDVVANGGSGTLHYYLDGVEQAGPTFVVTQGIHTISVTDSTEPTPCSASQYYTVEPFTPLSFTVNEVSFDCSTGNQTVQVQATGGSGTLHYSLDGVEQAGPTFVVTQGIHTISVTDSTEPTPCSASQYYTVEPFTPLSFTVNEVSFDCSTGNQTVTVEATGGSGTLHYSLDGVEQAGPTFVVTQGIHTISVTDSTEPTPCSASQYYTVEPFTALSFTINEVSFDCSTGSQNVDVVANGGSGTLHYYLDGVQQAGPTFVVTQGIHTISVTDSTEPTPCSASQYYTVEPFTALSFTINEVSFDCSTGNQTVTVEATGGSGTLHYSLDGVEQAGPTFVVTQGIHTISVTDSTEPTPCSASQYYTVEPFTALSFTINEVSFDCSTGNQTVTEATGGSGTLQIIL